MIPQTAHFKLTTHYHWEMLVAGLSGFILRWQLAEGPICKNFRG